MTKRGKVLLTSVKTVIPSYTGYTRKDRKEDDIVLRKELSNQIKKARGSLTNILEEIHEKNDIDTIKTIKKTLSEFDLFFNEVNLSQRWHKHGFFYSSRRTDKQIVMKLLEYDSSIIGTMENVIEASKKIMELIIDEKELDLNQEIKKIKQSILNGRNNYNERTEFIGRLK